MTTEPTPQPDQAADDRVADWEAFYRDYRKPGYIEGFEITTKLGGGMFGLVFRARRMSIGKDYAIKFLKVDDGEVRRAILSELEQVKYFAQIDHPNLVAIEDRGEVHGIPYLVMAYAGAQTLRDLMPVDDAGVGRVPTAAEKADLLRAFLQSCRGLQALHERSLVHFDIKPANVFLKGGVARLGDYGLSKLVTHSRGSLSMGRGTPYYMAPEMLKRRGDARSDIYSLGVMLYEILCGKVPFAGDSEWEVLRKHETAEPELPDFLTATERGVLLRCLQKEPEDRFESVQDLILALGAPTSTAAAAWNDVRDGATSSTNARASAPPPPPRSSTKPAAEENPYKEMADASKKAFRHANEVARDAMREAQKTARKAMKEASVSARKAARQAQDKWRESWQKTRDYSVRRWRTLTQLRKQKKGVDRDLARRVATAVASPDGSFEPKPKSPGLLRRAAYVAGSLALLVLTMVVVWVAVLVPGGNARYSSAQGDRAIPSPRITTANSRGFAPNGGKGLSSKAVFDRIVVPSKFDALVSRVEPPWAKTYLRDPSNAKRQLLEHIEDLRKYAPISTKRRVKEPLPTFSRDGEHPQERGLRDQIAVFARLKSYNSTLARDIASKGPVALAMVAEELTRIDYETRADIAAGGRYHRLLVDATACRDLDFVTRGRTEDVRAANQALGRLWSWFVNEFAHSESCWYAYQKLLR